ncbi:O-antigen ligase family protein [Neobacillus bataviensis]|uniref:O-antigen ligase family protein n=1 Tax=Neobacillus bataviensis TaxID=220685 RepID=UPI001CBB04E1|nr:O-antigen ligase family protein [Neobacillus bataviensis]
MSGFTIQRLYLLLTAIVLVAVGLFIHQPIIGFGISLLLALFVFYDEKIGILFMIIFVPIRPFLTVYNTGFKLIGDMILLLLLVKTFYHNRKNLRELFRFHPFEYAFFAFLILGAISALITGVSLKAIIIQLRAFGLFYLLFYIIKRMKVSPQDIKDFSFTTLIFGVLLSVQGLVEKISVRTLFLPEVWQRMELSYTNKQRIYGLMGGPNETGMFLLISFLIGFYLLSIRKDKGKGKSLIIASLILIATAFLLTYSRGAVLTVIAFLPVYLVITRRVKFLVPLAFIGITAGVLFFSVEKVTHVVEKYQIQHAKEINGDESVDETDNYDEKEVNRFSDAFSAENRALSNADGRAYYFKKSLEVLKTSPIIGYGFGTFGGSATLIYSSPIYKHFGIKGDFYSDNQYTQIIAETGVIGIILLAAFVIFLMKITWDLRKKQDLSPLLIYFIVAAVVSGAVYNILEMDAFTMYYFIILGYAIRFIKNRETV